MDSGLPSFPRDFTCPVVLETTATARRPGATGLSPATVCRSRHFAPRRVTAAKDAPFAAGLTTPTTQRVHAWHVVGLDISPVRSPLLRAGFCFLRLLRCFSSPRSLPAKPGPLAAPAGVAPFGDGGLDAWLPLPHPCAADRRPSSAGRAKASSDRAFCLAWS